ncbi:serine hydrolase [Spirosoma flavum]|uniref:Serine hydrolase n=1 Tax=Spirosoma flavum TaxID=2048557 RepID=A0ABW6ATT8_9BACT
MNFPGKVGLLFVLLVSQWIKGWTQPITARQLDQLVQRNRTLCHIPGIAVAIIKDGKLIHCKGYGLRSLRTKQPVTPQTLFGIASNSKAFTAAAIALLMEEGKLQWDDRVNKYLPNFRLYDTLASQQLTIRDLVSHRSGLPTQAGDLMHDPDSTNFTLEDILYNQRFIRPASSFRSQFAYSNNGYLVAGAIVARVSGMSWENFVEQRILGPLGMTQSAASFQGCQTNPNLIDAHKRIGDSVRVVARYGSTLDDAAGGIYSSIEEMSRWVLLFLNQGRYGPALSKRFLPEPLLADLVAPQTIIPVQQPGSYRTHFAAYGLGWFLSDVKGYKEIAHSGQDVGMVSAVTMVPELGLGVIVLTNSESGAASAINDQIVDSYIGIVGQDRTGIMYQREQAQQRATQTILDSIQQQVARQASVSQADLASYVGVYRDRWFGKIDITLRDHQLWFASERSPQLRGYMRPFGAAQFVIKWQNPELDSGVLVRFGSSLRSTTSSFVLRELTSTTGHAYDDLRFERIPK